MPETQSQAKFSGNKVVVGCVIIMFLHTGCTSTLAVLLPHFLNRFNCTMSSLTFALIASTVVGFLASFTAAPLIKKLSPKRAFMVGTLACALSMSFRAMASAPWMLFVSSVFSGFLLAYGTQITCTSILNKWFIEKRGTAISIALAASGLGGAAFMFLGGNMIEPLGQFKTYAILGTASVLLCLFCEIFLLKNKPEDIGQKPLGWEREQITTSEQTVTVAQNALSFAKIKKSCSFWLLMSAIFMVAVLVTCFATYTATFFVTNGIPQSTASTLCSLMTLLGSFASVLMGRLADKRGVRVFLVVIFGCQIIGIIAAVLWDTLAPSAFMMVLMILFFSLSKPMGLVTSVVSSEAFGPQNVDKTMSMMMVSFYLGSTATVMGFNALFDSFGSFAISFTVTAGLAGIALILILLGLKLSPVKMQQLNNSR